MERGQSTLGKKFVILNRTIFEDATFSAFGHRCPRCELIVLECGKEKKTR